MRRAAFDEQSPEALEAASRLVRLCIPNRPCNEKTCRRCRRRVREDWQREMEQRDMELAIWGVNE